MIDISSPTCQRVAPTQQRPTAPQAAAHKREQQQPQQRRWQARAALPHQARDVQQCALRAVAPALLLVVDAKCLLELSERSAQALARRRGRRGWMPAGDERSERNRPEKRVRAAAAGHARLRGVAYSSLEEGGLRLMVTEAAMQYHSPGRYDDVLAITARLSESGPARVRFDYEVRRDGEDEVLVTGHTVLASIAEDGRPCRMPAELREIFDQDSGE